MKGRKVVGLLHGITTRPPHYITIAVTVVVGILASIGADLIVARGEYRLAQLSFVELAKDHLEAIDADLDHATDLLYTLRDFIQSTDHPVSRAEYQAFAKSQRTRIDGLRDTGWAPRVSADEREEFERTVRADGFADFEIREQGAAGTLVRAGQRTEYFPILYPDPVERTPKVLGFDIASEPVRDATLRRALATGRSAATPPMQLITVKHAAGGFLSFLPVFGKDKPHDQPLGFVLGMFETGWMIDRILAARTRLTGLDIYFYNPAAPAGDRLIYWHPAASGPVPAPIPTEASLLSRLHWNATFQVVDQIWGAILVPANDLGSRRDGWHAILALCSGLTMTTMVVAYLVISIRRTMQLEHLTANLRVTTADLQAKGVTLAYMARHDSLTGLANRVAFHDVLQRALHGAGRGQGCAVLLLDLDRFKAVNDTMGHHAGDALLCQVAHRLRNRVRQVDAVARLGGDEFAVVQADVRLPGDADTLAESLVAALGEPYAIDGHAVEVGASIGIVLVPGGEAEADVEMLMRNADAALYRAKLDGRGTWRVFEPDMVAGVEVVGQPAGAQTGPHRPVLELHDP
jgi:diguanylate cyclase